MKRYAIVRVDKGGCSTQLLERCLDYKKPYIQCDECYGDTKEQLIRKVAQVICKYTFLGSLVKRYAYTIATEIVEFLGVEE